MQQSLTSLVQPTHLQRASKDITVKVQNTHHYFILIDKKKNYGEYGVWRVWRV